MHINPPYENINYTPKKKQSWKEIKYQMTMFEQDRDIVKIIVKMRKIKEDLEDLLQKSGKPCAVAQELKLLFSDNEAAYAQHEEVQKSYHDNSRNQQQIMGKTRTPTPSRDHQNKIIDHIKPIHEPAKKNSNSSILDNNKLKEPQSNNRFLSNNQEHSIVENKESSGNMKIRVVISN